MSANQQSGFEFNFMQIFPAPKKALKKEWEKK